MSDAPTHAAPAQDDSYRARRIQALREEGRSEAYVAGWAAWHDGFDPHQPLVGEDGLEYEDLAALLCARPIPCARNDAIQSLRAHPHPGSWEEKVAWQYRYQNRDGCSRHGSSDPYTGHWRYPQLPWTFARYVTDDVTYSPGPARAGYAGAGQAPADPVHPADQPPV